MHVFEDFLDLLDMRRTNHRVFTTESNWDRLLYPLNLLRDIELALISHKYSIGNGFAARGPSIPGHMYSMLSTPTESGDSDLEA